MARGIDFSNRKKKGKTTMSRGVDFSNGATIMENIRLQEQMIDAEDLVKPILNKIGANLILSALQVCSEMDGQKQAFIDCRRALGFLPEIENQQK